MKGYDLKQQTLKREKNTHNKNIQTAKFNRQTLTSEKNFSTFATSNNLVLLPIFNFSISVTNALPTTNENICVSTNLWLKKNWNVGKQVPYKDRLQLSDRKYNGSPGQYSKFYVKSILMDATPNHKTISKSNQQ